MHPIIQNTIIKWRELHIYCVVYKKYVYLLKDTFLNASSNFYYSLSFNIQWGVGVAYSWFAEALNRVGPLNMMNKVLRIYTLSIIYPIYKCWCSHHNCRHINHSWRRCGEHFYQTIGLWRLPLPLCGKKSEEKQDMCIIIPYHHRCNRIWSFSQGKACMFVHIFIDHLWNLNLYF